MSSPTTTSGPRSRRLLVAIGMVGSPLCIAVGNLLAVPTSGSAATQLATVHSHQAAFLAAAIVQAAGFGLLGALGVGVAMLLPGRGGTLATIGAILAVLGGGVMGGAIVTSMFIEAAIPTTQAGALAAIQADPGVGSLFDGALIASVGGLLAVIALLIGRPVRIWVPILLLVGMVLSFAGGGPLGAALSIPTIVATALLASALTRVPATAPLAQAQPVAV